MAEPQDEWLMLLDPSWQQSTDDANPPPEAVLGGWRLTPSGGPTLFQGNPGYQPATPDSPTDPADATLQLVARGEADGEQLLVVLRDCLLGVAVDAEGVAVVVPAPDDVPSVLVTTAPAHRRSVPVPDWLEVTLPELAESLPAEGIDVLLNPGAPCSMRLMTKVIKLFLAEDSAEN